MKAIIAAGGTGGHIFPGVAIAREILRRDADAGILFVGTPRGLESKIIPREGFKLEMIRIVALKSVSVFERIKSLARLPLSFVRALGIIRRFKPDVVIGIGGYASGPILLVAAIRRVPTLVVEPNALPGFTNRVLARFVDAAAVTFEESLKYFRGRGVVTGNPIRSDFGSIAKKERTAQLHVLVFGGSQGAHAINRALVDALPLLGAKMEQLVITHQTGERDYEMVKSAYRNSGFEEADVRPFINDMSNQFEKADLLICRSGATTAAEVAAAGKAAIFIPFPLAADDHQRKNAEAFERVGAGRMIVQKELTPERLAKELIDIINHPEQIDSMELASRGLAHPDAAERTVDLAIKILR
ncbi:MAG: undecaprenyldiphospho-muramoylpentapeptide beta-N-acetylglucosaminyltransferase [Blastocatellia bacterium]